MNFLAPGAAVAVACKTAEAGTGECLTPVAGEGNCLHPPPCTTPCEIECVSKSFTGSPMMAEGRVVGITSGGLFVDITASVLGTVLTVSGTHEVPGAPPPAQGQLLATDAGVSWFIFGFFGTTTGNPWQMVGTGPAWWTGERLYHLVNELAWGLSLPSGSYSAQNLQSPVVLKGLTAPIVTGTEQVGYFSANMAPDAEFEALNPGADDVEVLIDETFSIVLVKVRAKLTGLTPGNLAQVTIGVYKRLRGSSDAWVWDFDIEVGFEIESETEYTDYFDITPNGPNEFEYRASCGTVVESPGEPEPTYEEGYTAGFNFGSSCRPCVDPGPVDPDSFEQGFYDGCLAGYIFMGC